MDKLKYGTKVMTGLLKGKLLGQRVPIKVAFICSLKCNFKCSYCGVYKQKHYHMNTFEVMHMMNEYKKMGCTAWSFTGGEPLIRSDIKELVKYSKKLGFLTTLVTNGAMIKHKLDVIRQLDGLVVSIDGIKTNDKYRGKGSTAKALEGINMARMMGVDVTIQSVLNKDNMKNGGKDIKDLFEYARDNECKFIAQPLYSDDFNNDQSVDIERAINMLYKLKRMDPKTAYYTQSELTWMENYDSGDRKCYAGKYFITILPNGSVVPCTLLWTDKHDICKPTVNHKKEFENSDVAKIGCPCTLACSMKFNSLFSFKLDALRKL